MTLLFAALLSWWSLSLAMLPVVVANVIGSCCCETCDICSDDFNRTDDTDINTGSTCGWSEDSGSWDITSSQLRCTSAGMAICSAVGDVEQVVQVQFKHDTATSTCDLLVGLADASNYFRVRYTVNGASGTIVIVKVTAGTPGASLASATVTMNTSTFYTAKVCVARFGHISASLSGTARCATYSQTVVGEQCGLAASGSGTATFDDFVFTRSETPAHTDCDHCVFPFSSGNCTGPTGREGCCSVIVDEWDVVLPAGFWSDKYGTFAANLNGQTYACSDGAMAGCVTNSTIERVYYQPGAWTFSDPDFPADTVTMNLCIRAFAVACLSGNCDYGIDVAVSSDATAHRAGGYFSNNWSWSVGQAPTPFPFAVGADCEAGAPYTNIYDGATRTSADARSPLSFTEPAGDATLEVH